MTKKLLLIAILTSSAGCGLKTPYFETPAGVNFQVGFNAVNAVQDVKVYSPGGSMAPNETAVTPAGWKRSNY